MVIFVGVHGTGKTTQANTLRERLTVQGLRVRATSSIQYVMIDRVWYRVLEFVTRRKIRFQYHPQGPEIEFPDPLILERLFVFDLLIHYACAILSLLKLYGLLLSSDVVIEDEGSIFREMAYVADVHRRRVSSSQVKRRFGIIRRLLPASTIVVLLEAEYERLEERYKRRGSPIEPSSYIAFQANSLREMLQDSGVRVLEVEANGTFDHVFENTWKLFSEILRR